MSKYFYFIRFWIEEFNVQNLIFLRVKQWSRKKKKKKKKKKFSKLKKFSYFPPEHNSQDGSNDQEDENQW